MKKIFTFIFLMFILTISSLDVFAQAGSVSLTVNGSFVGTYGTIKDAWTATTSATGGVLIELSSAYNGSLESFNTAATAILLTPISGTNASNQITIRPASGATVVLTKSSAQNAPVFDISGSYITIDGRAGGIGSTISFTVQNQAIGTSSSDFRFRADASYNTLTYLDIQGGSTSQTQGDIRFDNNSTTTGITYNKVTYCNIGPYSTNYPRNLIYSTGASATLYNDHNEISNCNIYNWVAAGSSYAIYLVDYNSNWKISNNSFYLTFTSAKPTANTFGALSVNGTTTTSGIEFSNNYFGGTAPLCGGSTMNLTGAGADVQLKVVAFTALGTTLKNTVTGNTIKNISFARTTASGVMDGILLTTGDYNPITGNVIQDISITAPAAFTGSLRGIEVITTTPDPIVISGNKVTNFEAPTNPSSIDGIYINGGNATCSNNMVYLGSNTPIPTGNTNTITGINVNNTTYSANIYFNTVEILGTGTTTSYALARNSTGAVVIENNILSNVRGGIGNATAIKSATTSLTSNYNDLYSVNSATIGTIDGASYLDFATWQTNSSQDANSKSFAPSFAADPDLHLNVNSVNHNYDGNPIGGITTDIDGQTRNTSIPYIGADEVTAYSLPVELSTFRSVSNGRTIQLFWETKTEVNSNKFEIERSSNFNPKWVVSGTVQASGTSIIPNKYNFTDKDLQAGKYQYRLKMIDNNGSYKYSSITETEIALPKNYELNQNFPNPFNPSTKINYQIPVDAKVILEVYNIAGQKVSELVNQDQSAGYYSVDFRSSSVKLSSGVYIYRIVASNKATGINFSSTKKMLLLK